MNVETRRKDSCARFIPWPVFREAALICLVGAALGLGVNFDLVQEALHGRQPGVAAHQTDVSKTPVFPVTRGDVAALLKAGAVVVDARSRDVFAEGHLAGALSLPVGELETALPYFKKRVSLETPVIVYCSGYGCPDSEDVAERLMREGYADVSVYEGGFPEWLDAGLPVETGVTP